MKQPAPCAPEMEQKPRVLGARSTAERWGWDPSPLWSLCGRVVHSTAFRRFRIDCTASLRVPAQWSLRPQISKASGSERHLVGLGWLWPALGAAQGSWFIAHVLAAHPWPREHTEEEGAWTHTLHASRAVEWCCVDARGASHLGPAARSHRCTHAGASG